MSLQGVLSVLKFSNPTLGSRDPVSFFSGGWGGVYSRPKIQLDLHPLSRISRRVVMRAGGGTNIRATFKSSSRHIQTIPVAFFATKNKQTNKFWWFVFSKALLFSALAKTITICVCSPCFSHKGLSQIC